MNSNAPISDLITGTVLYNKMVEDIVNEETELTLTEYRILFYLATCKEKEARIRTLADALIISTSTASDAVKALCSRNLAVKSTHGSDLKAVWAGITEEGLEAVKTCNAVVVRETAEYWAALDPKIAESYLEAVPVAKRIWEPLAEGMDDVNDKAVYPFITRWHMLGYTSWFKSTFNLSLADARILILLCEYNDRFACIDVAHLLKVSPSVVSKSVRYMSRVRGLIDRSTADNKKNEVIISLTDKGRKTAQELVTRFKRYYMEQFHVTSDEYERMLQNVHPRKRKSYMEKTFGSDFLS